MAERRTRHHDSPRRSKRESEARTVAQEELPRTRAPYTPNENEPPASYDSSSSSYIDISRTYPRLPRGLAAIAAFFTAPPEHRQRPRRRRSRRVLRLGNSSSSSINSDLAYGTGFIRRRKSEKARGKRREGDERNTGVPGASGASGPPLNDDAEILRVGAELAALARKQNRLDLKESRRTGGSPSKRSDTGRRNGLESSRGLNSSKISHGPDEEGWESATDADSETSSVDSRLAYGHRDDQGWGFGFGGPKRKDSIVDPKLFGPANSLLGVVDRPVGFHDNLVDHDDLSDYMPPTIAQLEKVRKEPSKPSGSGSATGSLQQVEPRPIVEDPSRFGPTRSTVSYGQKPPVPELSGTKRYKYEPEAYKQEPYGQEPYSQTPYGQKPYRQEPYGNQSYSKEPYVSRPAPAPIQIQQPQPLPRVSQSVYDPSYTVTAEPKVTSSSGRSKSSVAGAAIAGLAGAAVVSSMVSDRRDDERKDRDRRREEDRDRYGDDRGKERRSDEVRDRRNPKEDDDADRREKRRERRPDETEEDRERRRERRRNETEEERDRRREKRREERREDDRDQDRGDKRSEKRQDEDRPDAMREKRGEERYDNRYNDRPTKKSDINPTPVDPFQYQVADDAFKTPDGLSNTQPFTGIQRARSPLVHTVERVPHWHREEASATTKDQPTEPVPVDDMRREDSSDERRRRHDESRETGRTEKEAESILEETEHFTAPIGAAAVGAAIAAVQSEEKRKFRKRQRDDDSRGRDRSPRDEPDPIQAEADRIYREAVLARKISVANQGDDPVIRVVTPPEMAHKRQESQYDAPNADFQLDHVMDPYEFMTTPIRGQGIYPRDSDFNREPVPELNRPLLTLVRPTPNPSPAPEKQQFKSSSKKAMSNESSSKEPVSEEPSSREPSSKESTREVEPAEAKPEKKESRVETKEVPVIVTEQRSENAQTPTSANGTKGVTWGVNETKHYEVESPSETKDDPIANVGKDYDGQEKPKSPAAKKPSAWGALRGAFAGGVAEKAIVKAAEAAKAEKERVEQAELKKTSDGPFEYRGVVVEPEPSNREVKERGPPAVGPKPTSSPGSQMPGAFEDDLDFTATLAAGLEDSGFDPNIVIKDPTYRRRSSPPGSEEPPLKNYHQPYAETVSDLSQIPADPPKSERSREILREDEDEPRSKRDKKDEKKRDKDAKKQTSETRDQNLSEVPAVAGRIVEEPESYSDPSKSSRKDKKSKKPKKGSYDYNDDVNDRSEKISSKVSVPIDAFDDLRSEATTAGAEEDEWTSKKSKKKSKRDSHRYDTPSQSASEMHTKEESSGKKSKDKSKRDSDRSMSASEANSSLEQSSGKKSKDKSSRSSGHYDSEPNPEDIPLPPTTASEVSRDDDYEPRKSKRSSKRDSSSFSDITDVRTSKSSKRDSSSFSDVADARPSTSSSKYDDDTRSVKSSSRHDEEDDSKSSKKDKKNGGFFGLFGSSTSKSEPERERDRPRDSEDAESKKKSKKSKRSSTGDSSETHGTDVRTSSNGHGYDQNDDDDDDGGDIKWSANGAKKNGKADEKEQSFLDSAGTLGAGVGIVAAAAITAQHLQSQAAQAEKKDSVPEKSASEHFSRPEQPAFEGSREILEQEIVDPEITQREFRPSIDPQYGDLLPLPPSDPGSPNVKSDTPLPVLLDTPPGTPSKNEDRLSRDRSPPPNRRTDHPPLVKTPSQSAVPIGYILGNRSAPSSPGHVRSPSLSDPMMKSSDVLNFPKPRSRPTSWESSKWENHKGIRPLRLLGENRQIASTQSSDSEKYAMATEDPHRDVQSDGTLADQETSEGRPSSDIREVIKDQQRPVEDSQDFSGLSQRPGSRPITSAMDKIQPIHAGSSPIQVQNETVKNVDFTDASILLPLLESKTPTPIDKGAAHAIDSVTTSTLASAALGLPATALAASLSHDGGDVVPEMVSKLVITEDQPAEFPIEPVTKDRSSYLFQTTPPTKRFKDVETESPLAEKRPEPEELSPTITKAYLKREVLGSAPSDATEIIAHGQEVALEALSGPVPNEEVPSPAITSSEPKKATEVEVDAVDESDFTKPNKNKRDKRKQTQQLSAGDNLSANTIAPSSMADTNREIDAVEEYPAKKSKKDKKKGKKNDADPPEVDGYSPYVLNVATPITETAHEAENIDEPSQEARDVELPPTVAEASEPVDAAEVFSVKKSKKDKKKGKRAETDQLDAYEKPSGTLDEAPLTEEAAREVENIDGPPPVTRDVELPPSTEEASAPADDAEVFSVKKSKKDKKDKKDKKEKGSDQYGNENEPSSFQIPQQSDILTATEPFVNENSSLLLEDTVPPTVPPPSMDETMQDGPLQDDIPMEEFSSKKSKKGKKKDKEKSFDEPAVSGEPLPVPILPAVISEEVDLTDEFAFTMSKKDKKKVKKNRDMLSGPSTVQTTPQLEPVETVEHIDDDLLKAQQTSLPTSRALSEADFGPEISPLCKKDRDFSVPAPVLPPVDAAVLLEADPLKEFSFEPGKKDKKKDKKNSKGLSQSSTRDASLAREVTTSLEPTEDDSSRGAAQIRLPASEDSLETEAAPDISGSASKTVDELPQVARTSLPAPSETEILGVNDTEDLSKAIQIPIIPGVDHLDRSIKDISVTPKDNQDPIEQEFETPSVKESKKSKKGLQSVPLCDIEEPAASDTIATVPVTVRPIQDENSSRTTETKDTGVVQDDIFAEPVAKFLPKKESMKGKKNKKGKSIQSQKDDDAPTSEPVKEDSIINSVREELDMEITAQDSLSKPENTIEEDARAKDAPSAKNDSQYQHAEPVFESVDVKESEKGKKKKGKSPQASEPEGLTFNEAAREASAVSEPIEDIVRDNPSMLSHPKDEPTTHEIHVKEVANEEDILPAEEDNQAQQTEPVSEVFTMKASKKDKKKKGKSTPTWEPEELVTSEPLSTRTVDKSSQKEIPTQETARQDSSAEKLTETREVLTSGNDNIEPVDTAPESFNSKDSKKSKEKKGKSIETWKEGDAPSPLSVIDPMSEPTTEAPSEREDLSGFATPTSKLKGKKKQKRKSVAWDAEEPDKERSLESSQTLADPNIVLDAPIEAHRTGVEAEVLSRHQRQEGPSSILKDSSIKEVFHTAEEPQQPEEEVLHEHDVPTAKLNTQNDSDDFATAGTEFSNAEHFPSAATLHSPQVHNESTEPTERGYFPSAGKLLPPLAAAGAAIAAYSASRETDPHDRSISDPTPTIKEPPNNALESIGTSTKAASSIAKPASQEIKVTTYSPEPSAIDYFPSAAALYSTAATREDMSISNNYIASATPLLPVTTPPSAIVKEDDLHHETLADGGDTRKSHFVETDPRGAELEKPLRKDHEYSEFIRETPYSEEQLEAARQMNTEFGLGRKKSKKNKKGGPDLSGTSTQDEDIPALARDEAKDTEILPKKIEPNFEAASEIPTGDGLTAGYNTEQILFPKQLQAEFDAGSKKSKKGKSSRSTSRTPNQEEEPGSSFFEQPQSAEPEEVQTASREVLPGDEEIPSTQGPNGFAAGFSSDQVELARQMRDEFGSSSKKSNKDKKRQSLMRTVTDDNISGMPSDGGSEGVSQATTDIDSATDSAYPLSKVATADDFESFPTKKGKKGNKQRKSLLRSSTQESEGSADPTRESSIEPGARQLDTFEPEVNKAADNAIEPLAESDDKPSASLTQEPENFFTATKGKKGNKKWQSVGPLVEEDQEITSTSASAFPKPERVDKEVGEIDNKLSVTDTVDPDFVDREDKPLSTIPDEPDSFSFTTKKIKKGSKKGEIIVSSPVTEEAPSTGQSHDIVELEPASKKPTIVETTQVVDLKPDPETAILEDKPSSAFPEESEAFSFTTKKGKKGKKGQSGAASPAPVGKPSINQITGFSEAEPAIETNRGANVADDPDLAKLEAELNFTSKKSKKDKKNKKAKDSSATIFDDDTSTCEVDRNFIEEKGQTLEDLTTEGSLADRIWASTLTDEFKESDAQSPAPEPEYPVDFYPTKKSKKSKKNQAISLLASDIEPLTMEADSPSASEFPSKPTREAPSSWADKVNDNILPDKEPNTSQSKSVIEEPHIQAPDLRKDHGVEDVAHHTEAQKDPAEKEEDSETVKAASIGIAAASAAALAGAFIGHAEKPTPAELLYSEETKDKDVEFEDFMPKEKKAKEANIVKRQPAKEGGVLENPVVQGSIEASKYSNDHERDEAKDDKDFWTTPAGDERKAKDEHDGYSLGENHKRERTASMDVWQPSPMLDHPKHSRKHDHEDIAEAIARDVMLEQEAVEDEPVRARDLEREQQLDDAPEEFVTKSSKKNKDKKQNQQESWNWPTDLKEDDGGKYQPPGIIEEAPILEKSDAAPTRQKSKKNKKQTQLAEWDASKELEEDKNDTFSSARSRDVLSTKDFDSASVREPDALQIHSVIKEHSMDNIRTERRHASPQPKEPTINYQSGIKDRNIPEAGFESDKERHRDSTRNMHGGEGLNLPPLASLPTFDEAGSTRQRNFDDSTTEFDIRSRNESSRKKHRGQEVYLPPSSSLPVVFEEGSPGHAEFARDTSEFEPPRSLDRHNRDSGLTASPVPSQRRFADERESVRDSGVHLGDTPTAASKERFPAASADDALTRMSWPAMDEERETVDLHRSQRIKADKSPTIDPATVAISAAGTLAVGAAAALAGHATHSTPKSRDVEGGKIGRSVSPNMSRLQTPDHSKQRPGSVNSNRSSTPLSSGTPPLRRSDRKLSGDLRSLSQRSQPNLAKQARDAKDAADHSPATSIVNANPIANEGRVRVKDMADVYDGFGEGRIGSPMSPTRPHSMRRRQSMQVLDLEARVAQLDAENHMLQEAKDHAEHSLHAAQRATLALADREAEVDNLKQSIDWLNREVERLKEVNDGLQSANVALGNQHNERYGALESQHTQATRELEDVRQAHGSLSTGMEAAMMDKILEATQDRDREIAQLRLDLETAQERIVELQREILASKAVDGEFLVFRDEDYFDNACQQLCQHVQQWVLRFSKFSDMRACRLTSEINNDKTIDRLDNAVLDGSDVDDYLSDRVKRRDIFMSMTMTMIWEFVFTRYLFGMDREQRQKLKTLEKTLAEVGPPAAVHQWRATTLTLLSKRNAFLQQREQDTEAVVQLIFQTLSEILPPPTQLENQIQDQLKRVMRAAIDLSIEMRTQRAEYMMLPPLRPEYDANGDLARTVQFNAALMNERSGDTVSNEDLEAQEAVVRIVLFPLVVKKGDDTGDGEDEIVVCPAQVLVAKQKKNTRSLNPEPMGQNANTSRMSLQSSMPVDQQVPDI